MGCRRSGTDRTSPRRLCGLAHLGRALVVASATACSLVVDTTGLGGGTEDAGVIADGAAPATLDAGVDAGVDASVDVDAGLDATSDGAPLDGSSSGGVVLAGPWTSGLGVTIAPGSSRLLVVTVHIEDDDLAGVGATVTSMTLGSASLTRVPVVGRVVAAMGTTQNLVEVWTLREADLAAVAGSTSATLTVVPQLSRTPTETPWYANVVLAGVDQTNTFGANAQTSLTNGSGAIPLGPLAAPAGSLVVAAVDAWSANPFQVSGATLGTQLVGSSHAGATARVAGSGSSVTLSFTHLDAVLAAGAAFVVLPAP